MNNPLHQRFARLDGDPAYGWLHQYYTRLYYFCKDLTKDAHLAEDLAGEVIYRVLRRNYPTVTITLLTTIAYYAFCDWWRASGRRRPLSLEDAAEVIEADNELEDSLSAEVLDIMPSLISRLCLKQQLVLDVLHRSFVINGGISAWQLAVQEGISSSRSDFYRTFRAAAEHLRLLLRNSMGVEHRKPKPTPPSISSH